MNISSIIKHRTHVYHRKKNDSHIHIRIFFRVCIFILAFVFRDFDGKYLNGTISHVLENQLGRIEKRNDKNSQTIHSI